MSAAVDHLLDELRRHRVTVVRNGERLKLRAPEPPPPELLEQVRQHKPDLLALLPDQKQRPVIRFRLSYHPPNAWATAIGAPGSTRDGLIAELRQRWPNVEVQPCAREAVRHS